MKGHIRENKKQTSSQLSLEQLPGWSKTIVQI